MITAKYSLDNHWTLDISGQDLYTNLHSGLPMVELQTDIFRYLYDSEITSEKNVIQPLSQEAKKCLYCDNNLEFKEYGVYREKKFCNKACKNKNRENTIKRKEYHKRYNKLYRGKNKYDIKLKQKEYHLNHKEEIRKKQKEYWIKNKDIIYNNAKKWKERNKEKVKAYYKKSVYRLNKKCIDCERLIENRGIRCKICNNNHFIPHFHNIFKNKQQHKDLVISIEAEQLIVGGLLGDASTISSNRKIVKSIFCQFKFTHCLEQTEYFKWKIKLLNLPSSISIYTAKKNATILNYRFNYYGTESLSQLLYYHNLFYPNGKKVVTREILDKLEPLGLAVWYCDDGCYDVPNASIYTNSFTFEEHKIIQTYFKEKWNLNAKIRIAKKKNYNPTYYTSFDADSSRRFFELIKPYVPECMSYKLTPNLKRIENKKKYSKQYSQNNKEILNQYKKEYRLRLRKKCISCDFLCDLRSKRCSLCSRRFNITQYNLNSKIQELAYGGN